MAKIKRSGDKGPPPLAEASAVTYGLKWWPLSSTHDVEVVSRAAIQLIHLVGKRLCRSIVNR